MKRMWLFGVVGALVLLVSQQKVYAAESTVALHVTAHTATQIGQVMTASPVTFTKESSGVLPGVRSGGSNKENWIDSNTVTVNNGSYDANTGWMPIEGNITSHRTGDMVVQVVPVTSGGKERGSDFWTYAIPIKNGHFASSIRVPYHGSVELNVGIVDLSQGTFSLAKGYAYSTVINDTENFSNQKLGLLESWMVNYDQSSTFGLVANQIVEGAKTTSQKIRDISHFVSQHIRYNWPAYNANNVPWQQVTTTYQLKLGVCQDESALAAALLRSLGIPTIPYQGVLYVNNQNDGSHEWDSAWDGQTWIWIDPTMNQIYFQDSNVGFPDQVEDIYIGPLSSLWKKTHREGRLADW
jgi:Transglutaminase-like superfamily